MSNFIEMAKNLYAIDKKKYKHFHAVFESIRQKIAFVAHYYNTNIDNIEEILSIAGILKSENLKCIDVLCKNEGSQVKDQYDAFINLKYPKYRFRNEDVSIYLESLGDVYYHNYNSIEEAHNHFFRQTNLTKY